MSFFGTKWDSCSLCQNSLEDFFAILSRDLLNEIKTIIISVKPNKIGIMSQPFTEKRWILYVQQKNKKADCFYHCRSLGTDDDYSAVCRSYSISNLLLLYLRKPTVSTVGFCVQAKWALSRCCKLACIKRRNANAPTTERRSREVRGKARSA